MGQEVKKTEHTEGSTRNECHSPIHQNEKTHHFTRGAIRGRVRSMHRFKDKQHISVHSLRTKLLPMGEWVDMVDNSKHLG